MQPQNSCPVQRVQTYLALRSFMSIQASGLTMSSEKQARRMLTSTTDPPGGFVYSGEYYEACRTFLAGTDPSMPDKTLIQPNERNFQRLLKITGTHSKLFTGETLLSKAKRDRAELANSYIPSAVDPADKLVATLKEANDIERERFENEKKRFENEKEMHDIKIAETKLKNVRSVLINPPASLSEAQLQRLRAQEVFLTGVITGVDFDDDLAPATSALKRKIGD